MVIMPRGTAALKPDLLALSGEPGLQMRLDEDLADAVVFPKPVQRGFHPRWLRSVIGPKTLQPRHVPPQTCGIAGAVGWSVLECEIAQRRLCHPRQIAASTFIIEGKVNLSAVVMGKVGSQWKAGKIGKVGIQEARHGAGKFAFHMRGIINQNLFKLGHNILPVERAKQFRLHLQNMAGHTGQRFTPQQGREPECRHRKSDIGGNENDGATFETQGKQPCQPAELRQDGQNEED